MGLDDASSKARQRQDPEEEQKRQEEEQQRRDRQRLGEFREAAGAVAAAGALLRQHQPGRRGAGGTLGVGRYCGVYRVVEFAALTGASVGDPGHGP
ncbi:hypothetical protein ACFRMQ_39775 [Kitasatospora sp. NPDC056783]|uniref:hypothetical protein n=1 Tax=Kitasatospora sp. NPDC056783 TaxID=3345943 RepID=UPI0036B6EA5B